MFNDQEIIDLLRKSDFKIVGNTAIKSIEIFNLNGQKVLETDQIHHKACLHLFYTDEMNFQ